MDHDQHFVRLFDITGFANLLFTRRVSLRWAKLPLDLRWLAVATRSKSWVAYKSVYESSPLDLRYIAVALQEPRWLHNCKGGKKLIRNVYECGKKKLGRVYYCV